MIMTGPDLGARRQNGRTPIGKASLREAFSIKRNEYPRSEKEESDRLIAQRVIASDAFDHAAAIFAYRSMPCEVDTSALIDTALDRQKRVFLPIALDGGRMLWQEVFHGTQYEKGRFGVYEPVFNERAIYCKAARTDACIQAEERSIALVPGLVFDRAGNRLGFGGGYYDRFLRGFSGTSFGLAWDFQVIDDLSQVGALGEHDMPVDLVITEIQHI